jgi:hypothetical protein
VLPENRFVMSWKRNLDIEALIGKSVSSLLLSFVELQPACLPFSLLKIFRDYVGKSFLCGLLKRHANRNKLFLNLENHSFERKSGQIRCPQHTVTAIVLPQSTLLKLLNGI